MTSAGFSFAGKPSRGTPAAHAMANRLLKQLLDESALLSPSVKRCLPVSILDAVEPQDASQYLKHWLDLLGTPQVPESRMTEFLKQLSGRTSESHCELSWAGWNLRLFRDDLILCEPGELPPCPQLEWPDSQSLGLGPELGSLMFEGQLQDHQHECSVGKRKSEATIRIYNGGPARKLKKVMQEWPVPAWQRNSIPILYRGRNVLAVGDWLLAEEFELWLKRHHFQYRWEPGCTELKDTRERCHQNRLR